MKIPILKTAGTLSDNVGAKRVEGKLSDILRAERERLFKNIKIGPTRYRPTRAKDMTAKGTHISYFAKRAQQFSDMYGNPRQKTIVGDLDYLTYLVCSIHEVSREEIYSKSRKHNYVQVRKIIAFFAAYYFDLVHEDIAQYLQRERSTVSSHIQEFRKDLKNYETARDIALKIDHYLFQLLEKRRP